MVFDLDGAIFHRVNQVNSDRAVTVSQKTGACHYISTIHSAGNVIVSVPPAQFAISSYLYWPINWPCHPICTDRLTGHVIISVPTTQLAIISNMYRPFNYHVIIFVPTTSMAMSFRDLLTTGLAIPSYLYRIVNWPCHPICTNHSTGHAILSICTDH